MVWVGGNGMSFWVGVGCVCYIGAYPTSPSSPPALRCGAGSTMASTITAHCGPAVLCLPTWMVFHYRSLSRLQMA